MNWLLRNSKYAQFVLIFALGLATVAHAALEEAYTFDPSHIKRDPFKPMGEITDSRKLLTSFDVTRFQLMAVITGMGTPKAMIMLPNRETEIVHIGDNLGKNGGKIQRITDSELVVREVYKDYQGKARAYFTSLVIAD